MTLFKSIDYILVCLHHIKMLHITQSFGIKKGGVDFHNNKNIFFKQWFTFKSTLWRPWLIRMNYELV